MYFKHACNYKTIVQTISILILIKLAWTAWLESDFMENENTKY